MRALGASAALMLAGLVAPSTAWCAGAGAHAALALLQAIPTVEAPAQGATAREPEQQRPPQVVFDPSRFDSVTAGTLKSIIDGAAEAGLPTAPLINYALRGAAMRVSGPRIVQAVRLHAAALSDAREALGPGASVGEMDAAADALKAGVDERTLTQLRSIRPTGSVVIPLVVLTDILKRGIPMTNAREAVSSIARLPGSDASLRTLQETVAKNSVRGPGMALDALNRYLRGTVSGTAPPSTPVTTDRKPIRPPSP